MLEVSVLFATQDFLDSIFSNERCAFVILVSSKETVLECMASSVGGRLLHASILRQSTAASSRQEFSLVGFSQIQVLIGESFVFTRGRQKRSIEKFIDGE